MWACCGALGDLRICLEGVTIIPSVFAEDEELEFSACWGPELSSSRLCGNPLSTVLLPASCLFPATTTIFKVKSVRGRAAQGQMGVALLKVKQQSLQPGRGEWPWEEKSVRFT